jgi:hypothetical protein
MSALGPRRPLLVALVLLAAAALALHYLAHPILVPDAEHPGQQLFRGSFVAASLLPLIDLVVVTALFTRRSTAPLAFLLNGVLVIYGTVLMGHFGIVGLTTPTPKPVSWVLRSMIIDLAIVWVDFLIGKALFDSWMREV